MTTAPVSCLYHGWSPPDIARLIVTVIIYPINCIPERTRSNTQGYIFHKSSHILPTFADLDPSATIVMKTHVFGILATVNYTSPGWIERVTGEAMTSVSGNHCFSSDISIIAPTRSSLTGNKPLNCRGDYSATVTTAQRSSSLFPAKADQWSPLYR